MSSPPDNSQRRRVLQVITRLGLGGAEQVAMTLIRTLSAEMDCAVFTVHGAGGDAVGRAMQHELATARIPWFTGTRVPMKCGGMVPGAFALARAVRQFRPDIIHYHSETPEACGAMLVQLRPGIARQATVRTIHNSIFWRYWPRIGRWCDRQLADAHIACVSEAAREEFQRYRADSGASAPPAPPIVIYNGVALEPRAPRGAPHEAGLRRMLFAGRFEDQKGSDVLCRALPLVRLPAGVHGELVLVGHGAHEPQLRALAALPPPMWRVRVCAPVSPLAALLPEFDLVVMPSRFEGLGLVAVEAILCGLPLVATDAAGLRETLPPDYPWLAQPGNANSLAAALQRALDAPETWPATVLRAQGFARARFDPNAMAEGYRTLYARALS